MKIDTAKLYNILKDRFGKQKWWPIDESYHRKNKTDPRFEIVVGAILTQNTAWANVEKALENLKSKNILDLDSICKVSIEELERTIKPSGFFKQKARRLKDVSLYIKSNYKNLNNFFNKNLYEIREELLSLNGIGYETADSILLYAANKPIFVVDAYTKRILNRLGMNLGDSYKDIQDYFQNELSRNFSKEELAKVYANMHAMLVILAKSYCKKKPICNICPLENICDFRKNSLK